MLIASFPARLAVQWFAPDAVRIGGVTGSVWRGQADEMAVTGQYFQNLQWDFKPWSILRGRPQYNVAVTTLAGTVRGAFSAGISGDLRMTDLAGTLDLARIHPALSNNSVAGTLTLDIAELLIQDGVPVAAEGEALVERLVLGQLHAGELGAFRARLSTDDSGIVSEIEDLEAVVEVDGRLLISPDRGYVFTGTIAPTPATPAAIDRNLPLLGSADAQGRRDFRFEGGF